MMVPAKFTNQIDKNLWKGYGIGWATIKDGKASFASCAEPPFENCFFHTGGAIGATSIILIEPQTELVVAIFTNLQNAEGITMLGFEIAKCFVKN